MDQQSAVVLLPIIVTLVLSLATKNVVLGLFFGVFSGVIMLSGWDIFSSFGLLVKDHLATQLTDSYNAGVLVLLVFIGGFVALMEQSGGGKLLPRK
ncbi:Na+/H+ antiporter [Vibrio casei]|nr:Na+/H+ antiporter [Vibrio casei]